MQAALPDAPPPLTDLFAQLEEAESRAVLRSVALMQRAAKDPRQWRAAAWWLERMHPEEFAKPASDQSPRPSHRANAVASADDIRRLQESLRRRAEGQAHAGPALRAGAVE